MNIVKGGKYQFDISINNTRIRDVLSGKTPSYRPITGVTYECTNVFNTKIGTIYDFESEVDVHFVEWVLLDTSKELVSVSKDKKKRYTISKVHNARSFSYRVDQDIRSGWGLNVQVECLLSPDLLGVPPESVVERSYQRYLKGEYFDDEKVDVCDVRGEKFDTVQVVPKPSVGQRGERGLDVSRYLWKLDTISDKGAYFVGLDESRQLFGCGTARGMSMKLSFVGSKCKIRVDTTEGVFIGELSRLYCRDDYLIGVNKGNKVTKEEFVKLAKESLTLETFGTLVGYYVAGGQIEDPKGLYFIQDLVGYTPGKSGHPRLYEGVHLENVGDFPLTYGALQSTIP